MKPIPNPLAALTSAGIANELPIGFFQALPPAFSIMIVAVAMDWEGRK